MKKFILLFLFFLPLLTYSQDQPQKKKKFSLKKLVNDINDNINNGSKNADDVIIDQLKSSKSKYDSTNFNFAIALSDNTGFYEEKDKLQGINNLALKVAEANRNNTSPLEMAMDNNDMGELAFKMNKFNNAEKLFLYAISIFEDNNLTKNLYYPKTISNLGLLYLTTGRLDLAKKFIDNALQLREEVFGNEHISYAASLNSSAILLNHQGSYLKAVSTIEKAIKIMENQEEQKLPLAILYNNKGFFMYKLSRYELAEENYQKAMEIAERKISERSLHYQRFLTNLALLYQESGKLKEAEELFDNAIKIKESQRKKRHPDYAHLLNLKAALLLEMKRYEEVEDLLLSALKIYEKKFTEEHPTYASTLANLGCLYRIQERYTEAEEFLKHALTIRENVLGQQHPSFIKNQEDLALVYWQQNQDELAYPLYKKVLENNDQFIQTYFPALNEIEKEKYWQRIRPTFLRFFAFAIDFHEKNPSLLTDFYNYYINTKGILVNASTKIKEKILSSGNQGLIGDYNEWVQKKELLAKLYSLSKEELKIAEIDIIAIEKDVKELERSLSIRSDFLSLKDDNIVRFDDVQKNLSQNEVAIEIINIPEFNKTLSDQSSYYALILEKGKKYPDLVMLGKGKELDQDAYKFYINTIKLKKESPVSYTIYWEKLDRLISGKENMYLSLDGIYNQLSINSFQRKDGTYVLDDYQIIQLTNTKYLPKLKDKMIHETKQHTKNALLVGFPDYGDKNLISELPGTKIEIETIYQLLEKTHFKANKILQSAATETEVKNAQNDDPDIIHIATHGFFLNDVPDKKQKVFGIDAAQAKKNPLLRAGLLFTNAANAFKNMDHSSTISEDNGILTAYEVMNMHLDQTELVVLSACETGLGAVKAGEGIYGLQRAFQVAGTDAVIMSMWQVDDRATQELMIAFYQQWIKNGDKLEAFRKAQLQIKNKYRIPFYWSSFVMVLN